MKRSVLAAVTTVVTSAATLGLTGCNPYTGINSLPLPGTVGTGADSYEIKVQLRNANSLVANTPVYVDDINVGTTTHVGLEGMTPTLTLSIKDEVRLPANATAALAQTSLLGSKHIDLITPADPVGTLEPGALIKEDRVKQYPETEDLLAGVSTLLNGGGLQHVQTITSELNRALGRGRDADARELLTQFKDFSVGIDKQTQDITYALRSFDRLGATFAPRMDEINVALDRLPAGLDTVNELEPRLVRTLDRLGDATSSLAPFADEGTEQLKGVLHELESPMKHIGDIHPGTPPRMLRKLPFVIFTLDGLPYLVRGDYANLSTPVNLTLESLDQNLLTGTPLSGSLYSIARAAQANRGNPNGPSVPPLDAIPDIPFPLPPPSDPPLSGRSGSHPLDAAPQPKLPALPGLGN